MIVFVDFIGLIVFGAITWLYWPVIKDLYKELRK